MNTKNKTHKYVPRNDQINLSAQELDFEGNKLIGKHEHCHVEKEIKGNQRVDKK